jgi:hypothetical protein
MNITEFEQEIHSVLAQLGSRFRRPESLRKRRLHAERAQKQILKIVKEARHKLDQSKLGLDGRWYSISSVRGGSHDRSALRKRLQQVKDKALAQVQELVKREQ